MSCGPIGLMGIKALPIGFAMGQLTILGLRRSGQLRRLVCTFGHGGLRLCPLGLGAEFVSGLPIGRSFWLFELEGVHWTKGWFIEPNMGHSLSESLAR